MHKMDKCRSALLFWLLFLIATCSSSDDAASQKPTEYRVTTILHEPFVSRDNSGFYGLIPDLLNLVADKLSINYTIMHVGDNRFGSMFPNGSWSGMIGELTKKKSDIAAAALTATSLRARVVKFSHPFLSTRLGILVKKTRDSSTSQRVSEGSLSSDDVLFMFKVVKFEVWIVMIVSYILVSLLLYMINRIHPMREQYKSRETGSIGESFYQSLTALSMQGLSPLINYWLEEESRISRIKYLEENCRISYGQFSDRCRFFRTPPSRSSSCLFGFWFIFVLLFMMIYISSATYCLFSSSLTIGSQDTATSPPIRTFKDLSESSNMQYGTVAAGATMVYFKTSEDEVDQAINQYLANNPKQGVNTMDEGFRRVRDGDGSYAFIGEDVTLKHTASNDDDCDLAVVGDSRGLRDYAFACSPQLDICSQIDMAILDLREAGVIARLIDKWMSGPCFKFTEDNQFDYDTSGGQKSNMNIATSPVGFKTLVGPIILLVIGISVSLLVLVLEKFVLQTKGVPLSEDEDTATLEMRN